MTVSQIIDGIIAGNYHIGQVIPVPEGIVFVILSPLIFRIEAPGRHSHTYLINRSARYPAQ